MCISLAYGMHVSNGSHRYFEALLMSFISRTHSKCPCLLATITLKHTNSQAHMLAGAASTGIILQVDL